MLSTNVMSSTEDDQPSIDNLQVPKTKNARRSLESQFETCFHCDKQSDVEEQHTLMDSSGSISDNDRQQTLSELSIRSKNTSPSISSDEYPEYCNTNVVKMRLYKEVYADSNTEQYAKCSSSAQWKNSPSRTPSFHEAISTSLMSIEKEIQRKNVDSLNSKRKKSKSRNNSTPHSIASLPSPCILAQTVQCHDQINTSAQRHDELSTLAQCHDQINTSAQCHEQISISAQYHEQVMSLTPTQTTSTESDVLCRICHDGDYREELVSPCYCSGSVGALHITCLEKWLGTSNTTKCEICKYEFKVKLKKKTFSEFLQYPVSERKNLLCDLACFLLLTPLTVCSTVLCLKGVGYFSSTNSNWWEVAGLSSLTACLLTIYLIWCCVAMKHHVKVFQDWRKMNQIVKIIYISPTKGRQVLRTQSVLDVNNNLSRSPAHHMMIHTPYTWVSGSGSLEPRQSGTLKSILRYSASMEANSQRSRSLSHTTIMWGPDATDTSIDPVMASTGSGSRAGMVSRETYV